MISKLLDELHWTELEAILKNISYDGETTPIPSDLHFSNLIFGIQFSQHHRKLFDHKKSYYIVSVLTDLILKDLPYHKTLLLQDLHDFMQARCVKTVKLKDSILNETNINNLYLIYKDMQRPQFNNEDLFYRYIHLID